MAVVIRDRTMKKQLEEQKHQRALLLLRTNTLQTHLKWVQHEVKNSALAMKVRVDVLEHLVCGLPDYAQESVRDDMIGIRNEVDTLLCGLNDHVVLGCLASDTYIAQWNEQRANGLITKLLRHFNGTCVNRTVEYILAHEAYIHAN